jgi:hypothetical protein
MARPNVRARGVIPPPAQALDGQRLQRRFIRGLRMG